MRGETKSAGVLKTAGDELHPTAPRLWLRITPSIFNRIATILDMGFPGVGPKKSGNAERSATKHPATLDRRLVHPRPEKKED
jgi:hypothetical protein